jgi:YegS/Rv2252/BmrU family lipid kinase
MQVILNPYAKRGATAERKAEILRALRDQGLEFDLVETTEPGAGVRLARQAAEAGYTSIVVVGGDGTLHEVVNGLLLAGVGPDDVTLGVVPVGSGNDFSKMLDLPAEDVVTAGTRIARGHTRLVDVGRVNRLVSGNRVVYSLGEERPRYFINAIGIGFDALVALETQKITWLTGLPLYLVAVIRTLTLRYRTPHMDILLDGEKISQRTTLVAIGNGRCQGGGFWLTPDAEIDDGQFDLAIARQLTRLGILRLLPDVMQGTHVDKEPVTMARARHVTIDTAYPLPVQADGEMLATRATHLEVEVLPRRLRMFA